MAGLVQVVVGGQFGSEGKGAICAYLSRESENLFAVRVAGPNAGHTVVGDGQKWALRSVPVAAVANPKARLGVAAGSEIDPVVLDAELNTLADYGYLKVGDVMVDRTATVIDPQDQEEERRLANGTTGKGIGSARARRIMREAQTWGQFSGDHETDVGAALRSHLKSGGDVMIEGTQGYGLGLHAGYYPHCTSSDCRAIDFLAMADISPWADYVHRLDVWVVLRTYPIRIAGNSGPLYGELTWEELAEKTGGHVKPEYTTVTKKLRRIGQFDAGLAERAIEANGGSESVRVALSFFDYWFPELAGKTEGPFNEFVLFNDVKADLLGTGPDSVIDLRGGKR